jgi:glycerophosphoryl diester phosphodiesterase
VTVLAVAHRAGNSFEALHAAVQAGADVLELDVHARRGRLEVRHRKSLGPLPYLWDRTSYGRVPLLGDTWELLPADPDQLLLGPVLDAAAGTSAALMLDLKGVGAVGPAVARALVERTPEVPVLVCSRWWPSVTPFAGLECARPVLSARGGAELARLLRRLRRGPSPYGVSVHHSLLDRAVVAQLRSRVEVVMTWPVNDPGALEQVLEAGVNGVITDDADVLARVVPL